MATFRFRLEKMLHFMRLRETMKKMEIVAVQRRVEFLQRRKEALETSSRQMLSQMHLGVYHTTKIALDAREAHGLVTKISEETLELDRKKRDLARLIFRKKGLESLREKKREEFRVDETRRQQKAMDDLHSVRRVGGNE